MSALALYIPCVYKNITEEMLAQTFYRLKVGSVRHVELVPHTEKYNKAHVFFESLYPFGKGADQIQQVVNGQTVKLQYSKNEHVFWLLMLNNREYDGFSKNGWYDVEAEEEKKADAEIAAIVSNVNAANTQESSSIQKPIAQNFVQKNENLEDLKADYAQFTPEDEDPDSFGLVSADYAHFLETEVARLQAALRNANDENQRSIQDADPTENQMLSLRRENYALRWGYENMFRIKMPPSSSMPPPVLGAVSPYAGGSMEYGMAVYSEIERISRDNDMLRQNNNVLSCMPDTETLLSLADRYDNVSGDSMSNYAGDSMSNYAAEMDGERAVVSDYDYDDSGDEGGMFEEEY